MVRFILSLFTCGLVSLGWSAGLVAQPGAHPPQIKEESNADHYHYEYDDGICHYNYEYNWKDQQEHVDRHGDCRAAALPPRPMLPPPPPR